MNRRKFLRYFGGTGVTVLAASSLAAWHYRWVARRVMIRLKLLSPPANYLRNADFSKCTTPNLPDYWGTPAAAWVADARDLLRVSDAAPLPGIRSVQLNNPDPAYAMPFESYNVAHDIVVNVRQPFTFSVYLKSESDDARVTLQINYRDRREVRVGREWQRYSLSSGDASAEPTDIFAKLLVRISWPQSGRLWVAAPQLERGNTPTAFSQALIDDHPIAALPWEKEDEQTLMSDVAVASGVNADEPPARSEGGQKGTVTGGPEVRINRVHRCLTIDHKPALVFGIAVEDENGSAPDRQFDDIAAGGFNTVVFPLNLSDENGESTRMARVRQRLDAASERRLAVIPIFSYDTSQPVEQLSRLMVRCMQGLKNHPAIRGWIFLDEPSLWWGQRNGRRPEQIRGLYELARQTDPRRPVMVNEVSWEQGKGGYGPLDATDIGSTDCYPIGHYQNAVKRIADLARAMNHDCYPSGKPVAFWLQLWGGYWIQPREPAPDEAVAMSYLALIRGARLLLYWKYKPMNPSLWERMGSLREELVRLHDIMTDDAARWISVGTSGIRVHYAVWALRDRLYLVACNAGPEVVTTNFEMQKLAGRQLTQVRPWYGGQGVRMKDNSFIRRFAPHEREVFELG
ncbi:MAG TPA: hypothetical protein VFD58_31460 [Blastocatellia bacterium]|nr:hypothetical protein [Blastocatellia bacterium]